MYVKFNVTQKFFSSHMRHLLSDNVIKYFISKIEIIQSNPYYLNKNGTLKCFMLKLIYILSADIYDWYLHFVKIMITTLLSLDFFYITDEHTQQH